MYKFSKTMLLTNLLHFFTFRLKSDFIVFVTTRYKWFIYNSYYQWSVMHSWCLWKSPKLLPIKCQCHVPTGTPILDGEMRQRLSFIFLSVSLGNTHSNLFVVWCIFRPIMLEIVWKTYLLHLAFQSLLMALRLLFCSARLKAR